ncbi:MAG TPA: hypothetical protein VIT92_02420, partial [Burkholderiaceae bacterium]
MSGSGKGVGKTIPIKVASANTNTALSNVAGTAANFLRPGVLQLTALPPLSLYIHIPWCVRKCPYCDFNSHAVPAGGFAEQAYVDALRRDLDFATA